MAPFKSKQQVKACFAQKAKAEAKGKKSDWDCDKWAKETKSIKNLPKKKSKTGK